MLDNVRRVSKQLLAYGTADAAVLGINLLLLPIYTRVLSPTEYGALALLLVFEAFLKPVFRWGLDGAFLRLYYDYASVGDRKILAGTIAAFLVAVNGSLLILVLVFSPALCRFLLGSLEYLAAFRLVAVNTFLANFLFLPLSLFRIQERSNLVGALTFGRSFSTILARLVLVLILRMGIYGIVLADVIVTSGFMIGLLPALRSMIAWRLSRPMLRAVLRYGFPQVPHGLLSQTMAMSDRYILGLYLPLRELGVYSIGSTIASLLKLYPVAFESAWMPFAFSSLARQDAPVLFARMATYAFSVLALAALALALVADSAVRIVLPPAYHGAAAVVPLLAFGIVMQASSWFLATSLNVAKRTARYPIATFFGAVAGVVASVMLIPRFGIQGAALGVVTGQTVLFAATGIFAQRCYPIPYEVGRLMKVGFLAMALYWVGRWMMTGAPFVDLAVALATLAIFPIALVAVRFFPAAEMADLRGLFGMLRAAGREHLAAKRQAAAER